MAVLTAAAARAGRWRCPRGGCLWRVAGPRSALSGGQSRAEWTGCCQRNGENDRVRRREKICARDPLATESHPPVPALAAEYGLNRQWLTAVLVALEDPKRVRRWVVG
jgi:hypothetical protein